MLQKCIVIKGKYPTSRLIVAYDDYSIYYTDNRICKSTIIIFPRRIIYFD